MAKRENFAANAAFPPLLVEVHGRKQIGTVHIVYAAISAMEILRIKHVGKLHQGWSGEEVVFAEKIDRDGNKQIYPLPQSICP